jgi:plastocyanin
MRPRHDSHTVRRVAVLAACFTILACRASAAPGVAVRVEVSTKPGTELAFAPDRVVAPAHVRVKLVFINASSVAHNLVFLGYLDAATRPIVQPGDSDHVEFQTPDPGSHRFVCSIHEEMSGTLETT